jgi:hypothetical protein
MLSPWVPCQINRTNVAHHSALKINVFTLTHRGDEFRTDEFFSWVTRTLQICLGVQQLRELGIFEVHHGGDYGILWPLVVAGTWAPIGPIRTWILSLLYSWPREGLIVRAEMELC